MTTPEWKTQLQQASFRGVNFFVGDAETVIGRRNVLHEYPLRDTPYAEDLGKKAREFTINAYVMGGDVFAQSKRLIAAIEDNDTPGVLIHPSLGLKNVIPTQCRHIFRNNEGGIEYFVLSFVEAGENIYPTTTIDTQSNSQKVAAKSITDTEASVASLFTTVGYSDSVAKRAAATLIGTSSGTGGAVVPQGVSFAGIIGSIISKGAYYAGATKNYSSLRGQISTLQATAPTLVYDSVTMASTITTIIATLVAAYPNNPQQQLLALIDLFNNFGAGLPEIAITSLAVPVATPNRIQMVLNQQQLINLVEIAALAQMVIAMSQIDFTSRQDALDTMATVEDLMEPKLLELADDSLDEQYNALNNARVAMVLDVKSRAATLKTVVYVKNNDPVPALVLAYKQYQDATQEADIVARNNIRNPVFVPPGTNIEILV